MELQNQFPPVRTEMETIRVLLYCLRNEANLALFACKIQTISSF